MIAVLLATALAGYGDARGGLPSHAEREVHHWTNAVRVDPEHFRTSYVKVRNGASCWDDFTREEKTAKAPMAMHPGLYEAARFHSEDMEAEDDRDGGSPGSSLSHDSSDGTSTEQRIERFYSGTYIGENVAFNYPTPRDVVMGWMCSDGHRANIMFEAWTEFGAGRSGPFWTQDFGGGRPARALNLGIHLPESPFGAVDLYVDVFGEAERVQAVVDGDRFDMRPWVGTEAQGVWKASLEIRDEGCHAYWFEATVDGVAVTWPESGAYGWGACDYDMPAAGWLANREAFSDGAGSGVGSAEGGCSHTSAGWIGLVGLLGLRRRRQA